MSEQARNKALMARVVQAFARGNLEPLKAALHPDVVWKSRTPKSHFRFAGEHHRHDGVTEHNALVLSAYDFVRFEPVEIIAEGKTVWGLFDAELRHHATGRTAKIDLALRWVVRDGMITSHESFFDTASLLAQQGDLAPKAPTASAA